MSPSDLGVFVSAKRAVAADEVEDSTAVKGNAVATLKQAVCTGARDLRALIEVHPTPSSPVGCTAVSLMVDHDNAALQVTVGERAVGTCL